MLGKYHKFIKYSLIGAVGTSLEVVILFALRDYGMYYLWANLIGFSIGVTVNFLLNLYFNFKSTGGFLCRFVSYYLVGIIGLIITSFLLYLLIETGTLSLLVAKLITIMVVLFSTYMLNKKLTFGDTLVKVRICSGE